MNGLDPDAPTVVGHSGDAIGQIAEAAILYPTLMLLGRLPGGTESVAFSVAGPEVVGLSSFGGSPLPHAFAYTAATGMIDLGSLGGPLGFSVAEDVNYAGVKVGWGDNASRTLTVPYQWMNGILGALPTFSPDMGGAAVALNEPGDSVGHVQTADGRHAALWPVEGGLLDLHDPSHPTSSARAINNARKVVGTCFDRAGDCLFLWDAATGMQLLPLLPGDTEGRHLGPQ